MEFPNLAVAAQARPGGLLKAFSMVVDGENG